MAYITLDQLPVEVILQILDLLDDFYDFRNLSHCFPVISKIINSEVHHFVIHEKVSNSKDELHVQIRLRNWLKKSILGNEKLELEECNNVTIYEFDIMKNTDLKAVSSFHQSFIKKRYSVSLFTVHEWPDLVSRTNRAYNTYYGRRDRYERAVNNNFESYIYPEFLDNHKYREFFLDIIKKSKGKKFVTIIFDTITHSIILNMAMALKYMFLEKQKTKMITPFSLISLKKEFSGNLFYFDGVDLSQSMMTLFDYLTDIDIKFSKDSNEMVYDMFSDFSGFNRRLYVNDTIRDILRPNQLDYYAKNDFKTFEETLSKNNIFDKSKVKPFLESFIESILLKRIRKVQSKHYANPSKADLDPSLVNENDYLNVFRSMDIVLWRNYNYRVGYKSEPRPILFQSLNMLEKDIPKFESYYKTLTKVSNILCDVHDMIMIDDLITKQSITKQRRVCGFYALKLKEIKHSIDKFHKIVYAMPWIKDTDLDLRIRLFKRTASDLPLVKRKLEERYKYLFEELQEIQNWISSMKDKLDCFEDLEVHIGEWLDNKWELTEGIDTSKK